ncbi:hypothetical protein ACIA8K_12810 [Catenuloplanes sp. NPDC051500]|uniref:hypothetical protein n=1 Tax=Catenuloplanes sp. NPDC051500 TaxID=3363959 RepID=UPI003789C559
MTERVLPLEGQKLAYVDFDEPAPEEGYTRPAVTSDLDVANLITSEMRSQPKYAFIDPDNQWHKVVLDIDLPVKVLPSTTEGHHHLFIDKAILWEDYVELMEVMARIGLIERGYLFASKERGYSCVRLPWVKKAPTKNAGQDNSPAVQDFFDDLFGPEPATPDNTDPRD